MAEEIRVLVADDDTVVRGTIRDVLVDAGLSVVGEASDNDEALRLCRELNPHVLLLDLKMPGPPAADVVGWLRERCPRVRVLVLTGRDDELSVQRMVDAGVTGYVVKGDPGTLAGTVRAVARGEVQYSPQIVGTLAALARARATQARPGGLTEQEWKVLRLVVRGWTARRIGTTLNISPRMVYYHVKRAAQKLGLDSRAEVIAWAASQGIE